MADAKDGRFLGSRYQLLTLIGEGAMGQVWGARVRSRGGRGAPTLAVKVLRGDLGDDPVVLTRFVRERSVLVRMDHPGVVKVVDTVAEGGRLAIVMELMPGGSLAAAVAGRALAPAQALPLACQVLDALAYAHARGVLHRDVKPSNILLGRGGIAAPQQAKLGDFGIASLVDANGEHSTGLVGSPAYMPPELFTSGRVSAASDVYSTGVMLYELLCGHTPFSAAGSAQAIGFRQVFDAPSPLPVGEDLWGVVASMLAKEAGARPTAGAAAEALRAALASAGNRPTPDVAVPAGPGADPTVDRGALTPTADSGAVTVGISTQQMAPAQAALPAGAMTMLGLNTGGIAGPELPTTAVPGVKTMLGLNTGPSSGPSTPPPPGRPTRQRAWRIPVAVAAGVVLVLGVITGVAASQGLLTPVSPASTASTATSADTDGAPGTSDQPTLSDPTPTDGTPTDDPPSEVTPTDDASTPVAATPTPVTSSTPAATTSKNTTASPTSAKSTSVKSTSAKSTASSSASPVSNASSSRSTSAASTSSAAKVSLSVSSNPKALGSGAITFTVTTSAAVAKLGFRFGGNTTTYYVDSAGTMTPAAWQANGKAAVSADAKTWTLSHLSFGGSGDLVVSVTAYNSAGTAVGTGGCTVAGPPV